MQCRFELQTWEDLRTIVLGFVTGIDAMYELVTSRSQVTSI